MCISCVKEVLIFLSRKTLYHYTMLVALRATIHDPFLLLEHGTLLPHLFLEHSGMTRTLQWRCFPRRPWTGRILCSTFDDLNRQSNRYICCINRIIRNSKPKIDPNPSQLLHRPAYWTVFVVQRGVSSIERPKIRWYWNVTSLVACWMPQKLHGSLPWWQGLQKCS